MDPLTARRGALKRLSPLLGGLLLLVALLVLHRELGELHYAELRAARAALPFASLLAALALTALNYAVLTGYDLLAVALRTLTLPGGHHFGGRYEQVAELLLAAADPPVP